MDVKSLVWQAQAAYLYVLHLDAPQLAWEYLRRNPDYCRTWRDVSPTSNPWGLLVPEDPAHDARRVTPVWKQASPGISLVGISGSKSAQFPFWTLRGEKCLGADGQGLRLTLRHRHRTTHLLLDPTFSLDKPYGYLLVAGDGLSARCRAVQDLAADCGRGSVPSRPWRPSTGAVNHLRMLQTLDGLAGGASHRQIARVVFGRSAVESQWSADGELRARLRQLIRRAKCLMAEPHRLLDVGGT